MMEIREIDGVACAAQLRALNALEPKFPELQERHFTTGHWWLALAGTEVAGFAGLVPFVPFALVGYLKRALVLPPHRGQGLQRRFLAVREAKARALGWTTIVTDAGINNVNSQRNLEAAGYVRCEPEQRWYEPSAYFVKYL